MNEKIIIYALYLVFVIYLTRSPHETRKGHQTVGHCFWPISQSKLKGSFGHVIKVTKSS